MVSSWDVFTTIMNTAGQAEGKAPSSPLEERRVDTVQTAPPAPLLRLPPRLLPRPRGFLTLMSPGPAYRESGSSSCAALALTPT